MRSTETILSDKGIMELDKNSKSFLVLQRLEMNPIDLQYALLEIRKVSQFVIQNLIKSKVLGKF